MQLKQWISGINAFRVVSLGIALLSIYTFVYNCVRVDYNPPVHTFWALMQSAIGVGLFSAGLFWDRLWLRICQVVTMFIVSMTTLSLNSNPWLGLFFIFVTLVVAYSYGLFDVSPGLKIFGTSVVLYLSILIVYRDPVKSLLTFLGFLASSALVGYILWDKLRNMRKAAQEASQVAHEAIDLLKKGHDNG